jgi:hypothetical protein
MWAPFERGAVGGEPARTTASDNMLDTRTCELEKRMESMNCRIFLQFRIIQSRNQEGSGPPVEVALNPSSTSITSTMGSRDMRPRISIKNKSTARRVLSRGSGRQTKTGGKRPILYSQLPKGSTLFGGTRTTSVSADMANCARARR